MKVLVTGVSGQLGYDVVKTLQNRKIEYMGTDRTQLDVTNAKQTRDIISKYAPDLVIHCGAYTAVDKAEEDIETCTRVNIDGTKNIAIACKEVNAKMVYMSTDYVFSGDGKIAFEETDQPMPINVYGRSKLGGEEEVMRLLDRYFILRTSWVFGSYGNNFIKTMIRMGKENSQVNVVADQIGSPTYTADLSSLLCDMIETDRYGIYHVTNEGFCSWADLAEKVFELANLQVKVNRISSEDYPARALRPKNSRLSKKSLDAQGFKRLPAWENALERMMKELVNRQECGG